MIDIRLNPCYITHPGRLRAMSGSSARPDLPHCLQASYSSDHLAIITHTMDLGQAIRIFLWKEPNCCTEWSHISVEGQLASSGDVLLPPGLAT